MESAIIILTHSAVKERRLDISVCGRNFFPLDVFGSSSKKGPTGVPITLLAKGLLEPIETDIPSDKHSGRIRWIFRERGRIGDFIRVNKLIPGDEVVIRRVRNRTYEVIPQKRQQSGIDRLCTIDWDFSDADTTYLTHGIHPYPAKFIPQIPNTLIQELSSPGDIVADIFCGSGTTLVEALTLKRHAIGIDANPLACLISRAKTTILQRDKVKLLEDLLGRARALARSIIIHREDTLFGRKYFTSHAYRPSNECIQFWFEPFVVEELAEILDWCKALPFEDARNIALTALSSIIVTVSKQDSDTRYVRRNKKVEPGDTLRRFICALENAIKMVTEFTEMVDSLFTCDVNNVNVLDKPCIRKVDLVVCSPPYPNAYSYHLYHRTRLVWLGMDQRRFKSQEIGSHRKYSSLGRNGATVETFRQEMSIVFEWLANTLRRGRHACFVIGDSVVRGKKVDNTEIITSVASERGFNIINSIPRKIKDTRKAFNPKIGKVKSENILIFKNTI